MVFVKKHCLYAGVLVVLLCVALGTFLVWRASQPVEPKTVYDLPKPNPERAEILKRALQPPKRAYSTKVSNKEATTEGTTDESLEATSGESSSQQNEFEDADLESVFAAIDVEDAEETGMINGKVVDWEKYRLYKMRQQGWYKPEDVPIINSPPESDASGVFIWDSETIVSYRDRPSHVQKKDRALRDALSDAVRNNNRNTAFTIRDELTNLNAPYAQREVMPVAEIRNIPDSWKPYFNSILNEYGIPPPSADLTSRAIERFYEKQKDTSP